MDAADTDRATPRSRADDEAWMQRALLLAERGRATVSPNPLVGCVLVRDGAVVGEGWHAAAGGPHAEVVALAAAGPLAAGARAYVTLEPCDHTGRTGPCTRALLAAGVREVVIAIPDPHPVAAGGAATLRAAGVEVRQGPCAAEAAWQNRVFLHAVAEGRPYVTLKAATSLDGRIAAADGSSRWLTGAPARARAHRLRAAADAVLAGSGTVLADDPRLTVRVPGEALGQPLRVVLDARRRVPPHARVFDGEAPTLLVTAEDAAGAPPPGGTDLVAVARDPAGGLDLRAVLAALWARGVRSVLVEGGSGVAGSFVRDGLVDELRCHVAPVLLGGRGLPLLTGDGIATLSDARRFALRDVERAGEDTLLTLVPEAAEAGIHPSPVAAAAVP